MNKNELTPQESLQVINEMIDTSKTRMRENEFIYHPVVIVLALIVTDLIPGYSLKNKYKKTYA
ncbi:MAG: hypothetical protein ACLFNL_09765 [Bacteroidales bacterium]